MTSLFILPLLASAAAAPATPPKLRRYCPPAIAQTDDRGGFRLRRGPYQPPKTINGQAINAYLLVFRTVDGCSRPLLARENVAPSNRRMPERGQE
jgi:hypothetical protein